LHDAYNDVHCWQTATEPEGLPDDPLGTIPPHRALDHPLANDKPKAGHAEGIRSRDQTKRPARQAHGRVSKYAIEVAPVSQSLVAAKVSHAINGLCGGVHAAPAQTGSWQVGVAQSRGRRESMACHLVTGGVKR